MTASFTSLLLMVKYEDNLYIISTFMDLLIVIYVTFFLKIEKLSSLLVPLEIHENVSFEERT
jgi:hypothetical protein